MKLIGKCHSCKKVKLFIRKRTFVHKIAGTLTSQSELCGSCIKGIIKKLS